LGALLAGCSLAEIDTPLQPASAEAPEWRALAPRVKEVFQTLKLPGAPKVSSLRRAHLLAPSPWSFCLRSDVEGDRRVYAMFVRDARIVDYRLAVLMDECENVEFATLDAPPARQPVY
jgi:hypothetical protein